MTSTVWFQCSAGVAGDMLLASLVDAARGSRNGSDINNIEIAVLDAVGALHDGERALSGVTETFEPTQRCGVRSTWMNVVVSNHGHDHSRDHGDDHHDHDHSRDHEHHVRGEVGCFDSRAGKWKGVHAAGCGVDNGGVMMLPARLNLLGPTVMVNGQHARSGARAFHCVAEPNS